jgi:putative ABC transport system substrate-binding protein
MRRRLPLILFVWLCSAVPAFAQTTGNLPLVALLRINTPENVEPVPTIFREALAALGQVDGRDVRIELRLAEGHAERFPELAQALVRDKASVIVASGDAAVRAAQGATSTIPIIAVVDDIVASGLVDSLAKPGGNTTGVSILASELDAKRLEILTQVVPLGRRIFVLSDPTSASAASEPLADAARQIGVELQTVGVRDPADFSSAFDAFRAGEAKAIIIRSSPLLFGFRDELCKLNNTHRLPAIGQFREMAMAGCLTSYGVSLREAHTLAAAFTDKMLRGARPADTPAQQPTKFELVVNLKTAKALGLTMPPSLLDRADEIIE